MCKKSEEMFNVVDIVDFQMQRINETVCGVIGIDNVEEVMILTQQLEKEQIRYETKYLFGVLYLYYEKRDEVKDEEINLDGLIKHKIKSYRVGDSLDLEVGIKDVIDFIKGRENIVSGFYLSAEGFLILKLDKEEVLERQKTYRQRQK